MSWNEPFDGKSAQERDDEGVTEKTGETAAQADEQQASTIETSEAREPSALERVTLERDEYLNTLQRLQAEFENYRKRMLRQQTELLQRASEGVVERLLPVLDTLDLALAHSGDDEADRAVLKDALEQVNALLRKTLAEEGLERIDENGVPFDPSVHDAVVHEPAAAKSEDDNESGTGARVSEVMRAGYRLKGRVLRPAMVKVEG